MASVLDDELYWRFSLAVYPAPEVARSCLALQAQIGLDVNVLLMALLAARWHQRAIGHDEIGQADARVVQWRQEIVVPLRRIRSRLKSGPPPAPQAHTDVLRTEIKQAELHAERIEQQVLAEWIDGLEACPGSQEACGEACLDTAGRVVALYRDRMSTSVDMDPLLDCARIVAHAAAGCRDAGLPAPR